MRRDEPNQPRSHGAQPSVAFRARFRILLPLLALAFALASSAVASPGVWAQSSGPSQYDVEAAYLYQFGNFVQWPSRASASKTSDRTFKICVLGRDPFGSALDDDVRGSKLNGALMLARRISSVEDAASCQIVFLSGSRNRQLEKDLAALHGSAVLTVSAIPDFLSRGGMVQFEIIDHRVRFEINLTNAQEAGLKLSSQLLKVAAAVQGARGSAQQGAK